MNKYLYFSIIFIIITKVCFADYTTPGTGKSWNLDSLVLYSGGTVSYSSGDYFMNSNLIIAQSDTIKIINNSTVKFSSLTLLTVYGTLIINPPSYVLFTAADTSQKYIGIRLDSLADASVFKRLIFEHANSIRLYDCNAIIDSCEIRNNSYYASGLASGAIYLYRSNPVISNCKIYRNRRAAINSGSNIASSPVIINNLIYENDTENYNTPQINLGAGGSSPIIIRNNTIIGYFTNAGGIAFLPVGSIPNLIIENNIIKKNRYGIALLAGGINAYINNNIIDSNNIQGNPSLGGSGLNFAGNWSSSSVIVTRNIVRGNLWGVTIQNTAKPNFGNLSNSDTTDIGLNFIYSNVHSDTTFDFYNNTPDSIKAENNFWGTYNLDSIEMHIFHKPDNPSLGFVDYIPIASPTSSNKENSVIESYDLIAYPNPFNSVVKISYSLIKLQKVMLVVYDVTGKEINIIENNIMPPGKHSILWNASELNSGIYFIRLNTEEKSITKKVVFIK